MDPLKHEGLFVTDTVYVGVNNIEQKFKTIPKTDKVWELFKQVTEIFPFKTI